jgi:uncharacterized protein YacL (UPF0231 family)
MVLLEMNSTDQDYTKGLDRKAHIIYAEWSMERLRATIKELSDKRISSSAGKDLQDMRKEAHRRMFRLPGRQRLRVRDYSKADSPDQNYRFKQERMLENPPQRLKLFTRSQLVGGLSPRQEKFCMEYMATGDIAHAYKAAGYALGKTESNTRQRAWAVLHTNKKIKKRLENLREEALRRMAWNADKVLEKVSKVYEQAMDDSDFTNANRSMETIARHLGMFIDKSEQKIKMSNFAETDSEEKMEEDIKNLADVVGFKVIKGGKK